MLKLVQWTLILIGMLCLVNITGASSQDRYPFDSPVQQANFYRLTKELRCLVCQNETLAESTVPLAADLRQHIYQMMQEGKNKQEIIKYLTKRYGDFVLFRPPLKPTTWFLWFAPFALLIISVLVFLRFIQKNKLGMAKR